MENGSSFSLYDDYGTKVAPKMQNSSSDFLTSEVESLFICLFIYLIRVYSSKQQYQGQQWH